MPNRLNSKVESADNQSDNMYVHKVKHNYENSHKDDIFANPCFEGSTFEFDNRFARGRDR